MAGLSRSSWHYRHRPRPPRTDPVPHSQRDYPARLSRQEREEIAARILTGWSAGESVDHSFAVAWDEGVMLGSRRSWWRIGAGLEDQSLRPRIPTRGAKTPVRPAPVVTATAPGQAWSWDITDLHSPWRSVVFKAYKITDIYSRAIVGWRVEEREADHLAVEMFTTAIAEHGAPEVVHADSGPAMRSHALREALEEHQVRLSHNRAYVSNDNPFSEAGFRTMKYRPSYPRIFDTLHAARAYLTSYVRWYNTEHRHSGIALFTPAQVADGSWEHTWANREKALQDYYTRNPHRFRTRPNTPKPADLVGINIPT